MLVKIEEAFGVYKKEMSHRLQTITGNTNMKPCEKCEKNITLIQSHEAFDPKSPNLVSIEYGSKFNIDTGHLVCLSDQTSMPTFKIESYCEDCSTSFTFEMHGFENERCVSFELAKLKDIRGCLLLFNNEKKLHIKRFVSFLNEYFKENEDEVALYTSLDKELKRKNNNQLTSFYEKDKEKLEGLDIVRAYLSENELFTISRIGYLYEKEYLQKVTYPLNKILFEFCTYNDSIELKIDIKNIENQMFFDVYKKEFVSFDKLDSDNIHMIKRNADSYNFFDEVKEKLGIGNKKRTDHFQYLFNKFFDDLAKETLSKKFGSAYQEYLVKKEESRRSHEEFVRGLRGHREEKKKTEKEKKTEKLQGIEVYNNVIVQKGIYRNMKGCVKEIDFEKKRFGIVFFGERNYDNVVYVNHKDCVKT